MRTTRYAAPIALACAGLVGCLADNTSSTVSAVNLDGAIYTSTVDGAQVNKNIYQLKQDVYLDGGPPPGAPSTSGALPEGYYYFMVTDPSGKTILSSDGVECRTLHINADGVIDAVTGGCAHQTGIDQDYDELGAITVQLLPYDDTPNAGGEYKVWITPVANYSLTAPGNNFGFINAYSKTDNFKVVGRPESPPCCGDGERTSDEECDDGNTTSGDGCSSICQIENSSH